MRRHHHCACDERFAEVRAFVLKLRASGYTLVDIASLCGIESWSLSECPSDETLAALRAYVPVPLMTREEFSKIVVALYGVASTGRHLNLAPGTVLDYKTGKTRIPVRIARRAREILQAGHPKNLKRISRHNRD